MANDFYGEDIFSNLPEKGFFDVTCQGCVPLSLYIASIASSYEDALRLAVSYGGDSDTLGAIVGSLSEAQFGVPENMAKMAKSFPSCDMLQIIKQFEPSQKQD